MPGSPYAIAQPDQADADPAAPADAPGGAPGGLIGPGQRSAPPVADGRAGPDESPVAMPDPAPEENPAADADPGPACDPPTPARPDAATPPADSPGEGGDGSQGPEYGKRNEQRWHHPDEDTPVSLEGLMDDE
jgi:hypothetical protein